MAKGRSFSMLNDVWFRQILQDSLGERFRAFWDQKAAADPLHSLEAYESILYSLGKQDLILILEILQAFSTTPSPRLALHALVKRLTDVLGVSHCSLVLIDAEKAVGTVTISHEDPDFEGVRISLKHYPEILRSLRTGKITIVKNPSVDPLMHSLKREQMRKIRDVSIMVLPLIYEGEVFGALLVRKQRSREGFVLREVRICQLMVHMVIRSLQRMCGVPLAEGSGGSAGEAGAGGLPVPVDDKGLPGADFLSFLPIGILLLDRENNIRMANQRASEITGIPVAELLRRKYSDIVAQERIEEIRRMRKDATLKEEEPGRYHVVYQAPDGQRKTLSCERHPFPEEGPSLWIFFLFRDVTKEKEMEESLQSQAMQLLEANRSLQEARASLQSRYEESQKTNERLDELNRIKTQFLAVATHEIRTPLSVVIGYNQFLLQEKAGKIQAAQRKILEESIRSCERLLNIVNDMLDFSRIETGHLELHLREQDALLLLKRVYRQMKIIADRAGIHLRLRIPRRPILCLHDPDRLEQVLVNLISNSIKFTAPGGQIVLSARKQIEKGKAGLQFSVADTGKGLSQELMDRILKSGHPFLAKDLSAPKKKGVGLGLAISRRIVEAHGSLLWAQSEEGKGATLGFRLALGERPPRDADKGIDRDDQQEAPSGH